MRTIRTTRFGDLEIEESDIVRFENGIPAFEEEQEFVLLPYDEKSPYIFLQSVGDPDLAFLMTVPYLFFEDYEFEIDDATERELALQSIDDVAVYVILTIPHGSIKDMTANLLAPVIINRNTMQGKQIVLEKTEYTTKHRLFGKGTAMERAERPKPPAQEKKEQDKKEAR